MSETRSVLMQHDDELYRILTGQRILASSRWMFVIENFVISQGFARKGIVAAADGRIQRPTLSPAQIETHEAITLAGGVVTTCRTLDEVMDLLATLGVPSRARSAISGREAA